MGFENANEYIKEMKKDPDENEFDNAEIKENNNEFASNNEEIENFLADIGNKDISDIVDFSLKIQSHLDNILKDESLDLVDLKDYLKNVDSLRAEAAETFKKQEKSISEGLSEQCNEYCNEAKDVDAIKNEMDDTIKSIDELEKFGAFAGINIQDSVVYKTMDGFLSKLEQKVVESYYDKCINLSNEKTNTKSTTEIELQRAYDNLSEIHKMYDELDKMSQDNIESSRSDYLLREIQNRLKGLDDLKEFDLTREITSFEPIDSAKARETVKSNRNDKNDLVDSYNTKKSKFESYNTLEDERDRISALKAKNNEALNLVADLEDSEEEKQELIKAGEGLDMMFEKINSLIELKEKLRNEDDYVSRKNLEYRGRLPYEQNVERPEPRNVREFAENLRKLSVDYLREKNELNEEIKVLEGERIKINDLLLDKEITDFDKRKFEKDLGSLDKKIDKKRKFLKEKEEGYESTAGFAIAGVAIEDLREGRKSVRDCIAVMNQGFKMAMEDFEKNKFAETAVKAISAERIVGMNDDKVARYKYGFIKIRTDKYKAEMETKDRKVNNRDFESLANVRNSAERIEALKTLFKLTGRNNLLSQIEGKEPTVTPLADSKWKYVVTAMVNGKNREYTFIVDLKMKEGQNGRGVFSSRLLPGFVHDNKIDISSSETIIEEKKEDEANKVEKTEPEQNGTQDKEKENLNNENLVGQLDLKEMKIGTTAEITVENATKRWRIKKRDDGKIIMFLAGNKTSVEHILDENFKFETGKAPGSIALFMENNEGGLASEDSTGADEESLTIKNKVLKIEIIETNVDNN